jgi:hypothetical protein
MCSILCWILSIWEALSWIFFLQFSLDSCIVNKGKKFELVLCYWMHLEGFQVVSSHFWALLCTGLTGQVHQSDRSECWSYLHVAHRSDRWCWPVWPITAELMQLLYFLQVVDMHSSNGSCIGSGGACMCVGGALLVFELWFGGLRSLLEHSFVLDVSSRCPWLRGPRLVFFMWSFSLLVWLSIACWSFFLFVYFLFLFCQVTISVCCQCTHQGGDWGPCVVRGPVDGRFLVWWVIDNVVWTDSWLSIAGAGFWRPRFLINLNRQSTLLTVVKSRSTWVLTSKTSPTNPNDPIDQVDTRVWSTLGQCLGQTPPKP